MSMLSLTKSESSDIEFEFDIESEYSFDDDEEVIFEKNGYKKIKKMCDTLQGQLFKAIKVDENRGSIGYVAIKRTNKHLLRQKIAIENGTSLCVSENIVKEALILRYLTVDHTPIGDYIVKYIDFFESNTDWYLVMEYIESEMNLKQFIAQSRVYIRRGLLAPSQYHKMLKYVLWQLFVTIQWMHTMHCAHLDICTENVMLKNAIFIKNPSKISIHPKISIKLCDFGVAEIFKANRIFLCEKPGLSIYNEGYHAPNVFHHRIFNASCADNWMLGMILFECITVGQHLYSPQSMYCSNSGYSSLFHRKLRAYLESNRLLSYFSHESFTLLNALLNVDEQRRLNGLNILKHKWFKIYFARYRKQIIKKFYPKKEVLIYREHKLNRIQFPFYC